ncbi:MAG: response regulator [Alphaproteobacteria bacterium]|nr:response regulator [Alphaproteobacteria bacterium]
MTQSASPTPDRFPGLTVLLVEDEAVSRMLTVALLKALGVATVIEVTNAPAALERLRAGPPVDIVLTDIHMPFMSGLSMLDTVRAGAQGIDPNLPVVILTAISDKGIVEKACQRGIDGYLVKPPSVAALAQAIRKVLDAGSKAA